jgi:hypothetical protein
MEFQEWLEAEGEEVVVEVEQQEREIQLMSITADGFEGKPP